MMQQLKESKNRYTKEQMVQYLYRRLDEGMVLPIFERKKNGFYRIEYTVKLLKKIDNWREPVPYPFIEYSEKRVINAVKEIWKVKIVSDSVFENGKVLVRKIPKFFSYGLIKDIDADCKREVEDVIGSELSDENLIE